MQNRATFNVVVLCHFVIVHLLSSKDQPMNSMLSDCQACVLRKQDPAAAKCVGKGSITAEQIILTSAE